VFREVLVGERAFVVAGLAVWNSSSCYISDYQSVNSSKTAMKTFCLWRMFDCHFNIYILAFTISIFLTISMLVVGVLCTAPLNWFSRYDAIEIICVLLLLLSS